MSPITLGPAPRCEEGQVKIAKKMYCDICGEGFSYKLKRIPVEREPGQITSEWACELCDEQHNADQGRIYTYDELMEVLGRLADYGYCCGSGEVKELVGLGWAELAEEHYGYQYAWPTSRGLIVLGEAVLAGKAEE